MSQVFHLPRSFSRPQITAMQLVASVAAGSGELASTSGAGQTGREEEPAETSTDDSSLYDPWTQVECSYQVDSSGEPLDLGDQADYQTDSSDWTEDQADYKDRLWRLELLVGPSAC